MTRTLRKLLAALCAVTAFGTLRAQPAEPTFTVLSAVREAGPRVVALAIDAGRDLPINWKLAGAFSVSAELLPVRTHAGDLIANSAVAKAPRTIRRAYTRATPTIGSPSQGRYVIIEMEADDINGASWYAGFNPGIRQMIPYGERMAYEVRLLQTLNYFVPNLSPKQPGAEIATLPKDTVFRQAASQVVTADAFSQAVFSLPDNATIRSLAFNLHKPAGLATGAKVPLVVFLHGSGQSHDYAAFPDDLLADVRSPLLANQGGVTWIENAPEKAYVLVPQAPARDTRDAAGEAGWRSADTQKLLLALVEKVVAENPAIDADRLYLTGLSMGAMGSWMILMHPDERISRRFAAAVLISGTPVNLFAGTPPNESPAQKEARTLAALQAMDFRQVAVPLWIAHADTDPVVSRAGARVPFAKLSGTGTVDAAGELQAGAGVLASSDALVRYYETRNPATQAELRYTEYQYRSGDRFLDLGMVTRNGHFVWEATFKDRAIVDWLFAQSKRTAPAGR